MTEQQRESGARGVALVVAAVFVGLLVMRWDLIAAPFANTGEAREAECIADVVRNDNWIAPYPNLDRVPTKGPFLYWWAGAASRVFGLSERVIRLSVWAQGLLTLLATVWIGRLLAGARAGWAAGAALTTCFFFFNYSVYVRVDMGLTLCVTLTLLAFVWGVARPERRTLGFALGHVALAAALFAKGLPALIPILSAILGTLALRRDWRGVATWVFSPLLLAGLALEPWLLALAAAVPLAPLAVARVRGTPGGRVYVADLVPGLVLAGLVFGWLTLADARYPTPYLEFVIEDSVDRIDPAAWAEGAGRKGGATDSFLRPFYWYLPRYAVNALPWLLFLPTALAWVFAEVRARRDDLRIVPWLWFVLPFLVFSAVSYKRVAYLLPTLPALALLVGLLFDANPRAWSRERLGRWLRRTFAVFYPAGAVAIAAGVSDPLLRAIRGSGWIPPAASSSNLVALRDAPGVVDTGLVVLGAAWLAAAWLARRSLPRAAAAALVGQVAILVVATLTVVSAQARVDDSPERLALEVRRIVPVDATLRFAPGVRDHALLFYANRRIPLTSAAELKALLRDPPERGLYLVGEQGRPALPQPSTAAPGAEVTQVAAGSGLEGKLVLLRVEPER